MGNRARGRRTLVDLRTESPVSESCLVADRWPRRLKGLLGRSELPREEALLLRPAPAVHTWFMRFPIDTVFLDRQLTVMAIKPDVTPWSAARQKGAHAVLELAAGESARRGIEVGDRLELR
jgi:uncharacterized membrane protein (UPF0127 family)